MPKWYRPLGRSAARAARAGLPAATQALLVALLAACVDSPTCVFTTGCGGAGGDGGFGQPATLPQDGQLILPGAPTVLRVAPDGGVASSTTPVVVVFSESIAPSTLQQVELTTVDPLGFPGAPVPTTQFLAAGGRMLLLFPLGLAPGDFQLRLVEDAVITDLQGQQLALAGGAQLAAFSVGIDDPVDPSVVTTFPADGATGQGTLPTIVAVFDRAIDGTTVDAASFDVLVGGVSPAVDPDPQAMSLLGLPETRVWIYENADLDGDPATPGLGTGADVSVTLSPAGDAILDNSGGAVATTTFGFTTADVDAPLSAVFLSSPTDAIGIANLTAGDPEELTVQVDLTGAEPDDTLTLVLFGTALGEDPQLIALSRGKVLSDPAPILSVTFTLAEIDLVAGTTPIAARLADGPVAFALLLQRGSQTSTVRVLDVDASSPGLQDPVLDTVRPSLVELLGSGGAVDLFRSDVRDLAVAGRASEPLRSVEVSTPLGGNGTRPPVVGSSADGLFVAAPVGLGLIDGGQTTFDLVLFDTAFNASDPATPLSGTFEQLGAVGPTPLVAGGSIAVEVFDLQTLAPLAGALVLTHADNGDGTFPLVASTTTDALGEAALASAAPPAVGTILTVDLAGYDLFTFHGVVADRISLPLVPSSLGTATVSGVVTTTSALAELTLDLLDKKLDDTRRPVWARAVYTSPDCFTDPFGGSGISCPYGPETILPDQLGAQSFLAGNFQLTEVVFSALTLLQAFDLEIPVPATVGGDADTTSVELPFLLTEPGVAPGELPIELVPTTLDAVFAPGIDLADLVDDVATTGAPWITVETLVPGLRGSPAVGFGLAFDQGPGVWSVRSAFPGAVGPAGSLGLSGIVDTDLFLRAEIRDASGNRGGQRPRMSTLAGLPIPNTLFVANPAAIVSPAAGSSTGGSSFEVDFVDVILDAAAEPGLYRVTLEDDVGRCWRLFVADRTGALGGTVHVPDIAAGGGVPLADGPIDASVGAYAWPTFDPGDFLFTDIEREYDVFSERAPIQFTQP